MFRLSIVVGVAVLGISLLLTGSGLSQTETKDPVKTKGKLPQYWKSLALNDSQKEQLFSIQASYGNKIEALASQIKQLRKQEKTEMEKILTDDQKATLRRLILEKAPKTDTDKKTENK